MYGLMGGLLDGLMEIEVIGLVDTNVYGGINGRKGRVFKGRCWKQKVGSKRVFVDIWKGWMDGWKDVISNTLCWGPFKILLGPVKGVEHVPYTRIVLK
jgi:hypothetical protein